MKLSVFRHGFLPYFTLGLMLVGAGIFASPLQAHAAGGGMGPYCRPPEHPTIRGFGAPDHIVFSAQPPASVTSGQTFSLEVTIQDSGNSTVGDATDPITVQVWGGSGTLAGTLTQNAVNGVATFSDLHYDVAESISITANDENIVCSYVSSDPITVTVGTAAKVAFTSVTPSTPTAGQTFSVAVSVEDSGGNVVTSDNGRAVSLGYPGSRCITHQGDAFSGTLTHNTVNGVATFGDLSFTEDQLCLDALSDGLTSAESYGINLLFPRSLVFSVQPASSITIGDTFSVTVEVKDADNNLVTDATDQITLALSANSSHFHGTLVKNAVGGIAVFDDLSIDKKNTDAQYTITAADIISQDHFSIKSANDGTSNAFDIAPGAPVAVAIDPISNGFPVNTAFNVNACLVDSYGDYVPDYPATITLALGSNPGGATFSGTKVRDINTGTGCADLERTDLALNAAGTGYTIIGSTPGLSSGESTPFTIWGPAAQLAFDPVADQAVNTDFYTYVTIEDAGGNRVYGDSTTQATIFLNDNPNDDTLTGALTQTADQGRFTFQVGLSKNGSGDRLGVSSDGFTNALSEFFDVAGGIPTSLQFINGVSAFAAGSTFSLQVKVLDDLGHLLTTESGRNITISPDGGHDSFTPTGTLTQATVNGIATFDDLTIPTVSNNYVFDASADGLTGATSQVFNVTDGPPFILAFVAQPLGDLRAGQVFSTTVALKDAFGNVTTSDNTTQVTVSLGLARGRSGPTLNGTLTKTVVNGVATFDDLSIDSPADGYVLMATADGVDNSAQSSVFAIIANILSGGGGGSSGGGGIAPGFPLAYVPQPTTAAEFNAAIAAIQSQVLTLMQKLLGLQGLTSTAALLLAKSASPAAVAAATTPTTTPPVSGGGTTFSKNLSPGAVGPSVTALQKFLISQAAGPKAAELKAHGLTKNFGPLTAAALAEFQKSVGVEATGTLGPKTRAIINKAQ